ncbi:MAG: fused MFS/spermidine synthase [Hyphomicrobiaceae bacterium]
MDAAALGSSVARRLAARRTGLAGLLLFAGTLFVSALLLFSVQPMFAKMVLPRLGGSPSVWAVSMCFFQAMLLAGYCYAHALDRLAPARLAPFIHLSVMGVALLALPIGLPAAWAEPPAGDAYLWLIGALAVGVGLPFFAVSANAPLIQSWFSRSGHPHAQDPYFLYGASNLGSLVALLAYPVLVEPAAGLSLQASLWTMGFVGLGLAIAACGLMMAFNTAVASTSAAAATVARTQPLASPAWSQRLAWIGLAAVPSGLLVAFSSYVTTDIVSAPFLWVLPLAIFLGTFVLVFRDRPYVPHALLLTLQPLLAAGVMLGLATPGDKGWLLSLVAGSGAFIVTTLVAHRELFERRPASEHLTEFYLWMSLGGVIGGVFAALVAPQLFSSIWEFPLLVVAGMACRPRALVRPAAKEARELAVIGCGALLALVAIAAAMRHGLIPQSTLPRLLFVAAFGGMAVLASARPLRQLVATLVLGATVVVLPSALNKGDAERSFFGVHRVTETPDGEVRILQHGTTIHGAERLYDAATGVRLTEPVPATYYHPAGPMALGVAAARRATGKPAGGLAVGIVGLGAGSMACHSRADEAWRFYEIDPVVVRIARDARRFSFLAKCRPGADIVLGDARLTVANESAGRFDYLVIDAFSSDAVPVHLLTAEAVALYLDKLSPDGLLAMHVSNRHLDLVAVAAAVTAAVPGAKAVLADDRASSKTFESAESHVVYVTRSERTLAEVQRLPFVGPLPRPALKPWTDDYSDILSVMWRKVH